MLLLTFIQPVVNAGQMNGAEARSSVFSQSLTVAARGVAGAVRGRLEWPGKLF